VFEKQHTSQKVFFAKGYYIPVQDGLPKPSGTKIGVVGQTF